MGWNSFVCVILDNFSSSDIALNLNANVRWDVLWREKKKSGGAKSEE